MLNSNVDLAGRRNAMHEISFATLLVSNLALKLLDGLSQFEWHVIIVKLDS